GAFRTVSSEAPAVPAARTYGPAARTARAGGTRPCRAPRRCTRSRDSAAAAVSSARGAAAVRRRTRRLAHEAVAFADVVTDHAKPFHGGAHDGFVTDRGATSLLPRGRHAPT